MNLERYNRQVLLPGIGEAGQRRIGAARVVVVGCGALGSVSAGVLARAGVGFLRLLDRDFIEESNLQRQVLFEEEDLRAGLPKAEAAALRLQRINSTVEIEAVVADVNPANVEELIRDADVVLDGADNFETRFVLNDACIKHNVPWVYGGAVGSTGMTMTVLPGETPCLRCLFESAPPPGLTPTCDTAGVLASAPGVVANIQAAEALKICAGRRDAVQRRLLSFDLWTSEMRRFKIEKARDASGCPCCGQRRFEYLDVRSVGAATTLCGRDAVQLNPHPRSTAGEAAKTDLTALSEKLKAVEEVGGVSVNKFLLRFSVPRTKGVKGQGRLEFTVFPDARAIIKGTKDQTEARAAFAKYVGV